MVYYAPTLRIIYDANSFPASAKCSACGEEMPKREPGSLTIGENLRWFKTQFDLHKAHKHRPEDVNRAAARIVGKVTSIQLRIAKPELTIRVPRGVARFHALPSGDIRSSV
jgi:hypothetical protein